MRFSGEQPFGVRLDACHCCTNRAETDLVSG
jgi:hypothetical protein